MRHYYPEPCKGDGGSFSEEQHSDDLAELVRILKLGKPHWLGWSRGGLVMVEVQKRHADVARTLRIWVQSTPGKGSTFKMELPTRAEFRKPFQGGLG